MSSVKHERSRPADTMVQTKQRSPIYTSSETARSNKLVRYPVPNQPFKTGPLRQRQPRLAVLGRFVLDFAVVNLAFILAYLLRYYLQVGSEVLDQYQASLYDYLTVEIGFSLVFFVLLQFKGFYRLPRSSTLLDEAGVICSTTLISVATVMVVIFIGQPLSRSRLMLVYLVPLTFGLLFLERFLAARLRHWQWKRGVGVRNLVVVGATDAASRLMQTLVEKPKLGYRLLGYVDDELRFSEWTIPARYPNGQPIEHIGTNRNLPDLIKQQQVQEIIIALPAAMHATINEVISQCREYEVEFTLVPDIFELRVDTLQFQQINGVPVIGIKANALTGWNYVVKRACDVLLSLLVLIICVIPILIITIAIKLDSPGPIIHKQVRIGKNGRPFTFYKFRSMYTNADEVFEKLQEFNTTGGATFKMVDDPRRTKVGRFLRRTSLDELPQIFNILYGHMSFVGPRPAIDRELPKFNEWQFRRFEVTPGLTGLWQVSGRSNLPFDDMVKLDIYYAENWSLWLDLKILLRTIPAVLSGEGAY